MREEGLGWAILGTGPVAHKFALGLRAANGHLAAIGSRDPARARVMAEAVKSRAAALDASSAVRHPDVHAVYIATPAALHEDNAMMAISAGKAVLVEKPLAQNAVAAIRIKAAAQTAGVFAMEALWTRFLPLTAYLREVLAEGTLGEPRAFSAEFMGSDLPNADKPLFDHAQGGALLHRGIYPLSLALHLMGPVTGMIAAGRMGATGVDEDATVVLTHASGVISTLRASLRAGGTNAMTLSGTDGTLRIDPPVWRPFRATLFRHAPRAGGTGGEYRGGHLARLREYGLAQGMNRFLSSGVLVALRKKGIIQRPYVGNGYGHEADEVARCIKAGLTESSMMPLEESIAVLRLIDEARAVIGGSGK